MLFTVATCFTMSTHWNSYHPFERMSAEPEKRAISKGFSRTEDVDQLKTHQRPGCRFSKSREALFYTPTDFSHRSY